MTKKLSDHSVNRPSSARPYKKDDRPWTVILGQYAGIASQNAAILGAFGVLGWYLDKKIGTKPWLLIVGILLGAGYGLYYMVQSLKAIQDNDQ